MATIFSIEFLYKNKTCYGLISSRVNNGKPVYRITIMNGELEQLISPHNIIETVDDKLLLDDCNGDLRIYKLKKAIVEAVSEHLQKEMLTTERHQY